MGGRPERAVVRESLLALTGGTALTLVLKAPVWRGIGTTVPADVGDPLLVSWILAWGGHALRTQPGQVFDTNAYWPLPRSLAFSEPLLGYAPAGLIGDGPEAALTRYAVLYLLAYALAFAGVYVLARQLGASKGASLVAGAAFAFSPFRVSQAGHLHILSSGGIPLALALLARGHGFRLRGGGPVRARWVVAGWAVATWQLSLGFGLGLMFAYLLAVLVAAVAVGLALRRVRLPTRVLVADAAGLVLLGTTAILLALPYLQAVEDHPNARRDIATVELYSPPASALVTAPAESVLYGEATRERRAAQAVPAEMALLPGLTVTVLAVLGLGHRRWPARWRVLLGGAVVLLILLALGTRAPFGGRLTYLLLLEHAPGWQGVRTPGRLVTLAYLGLALLAAGGVDALRRWCRARVGSSLVGAAVPAVLAVLVLAEGADRLPQATPRPPPEVRLADLPQPVLVLPTDEIGDYTVMWWSTDGFPDLVNGAGAFVPQPLAQLRAAATGFPASAAVTRLRAYGVTSVVVDSRVLGGAPQPPAGLPAGVTATAYGDVVVYDLRQPAGRARR